MFRNKIIMSLLFVFLFSIQNYAETRKDTGDKKLYNTGEFDVLIDWSVLGTSQGLFTKDEIELLKKTLTAIDYNYGYDTEIDLNYIFVYSYTQDNFAKKEKEFAKIIAETDINILSDFFSKIIKLNAMTDYKMEYYKAEAIWKYFNYIKNDLSQPLQNYTDMLKKYILTRDPQLADTFEKQRTEFQKQVAYKYQKEVITDIFEPAVHRRKAKAKTEDKENIVTDIFEIKSDAGDSNKQVSDKMPEPADTF